MWPAYSAAGSQGRARHEPSAEIPRRLMAVAAEMFARHGFAATRLREIVRTAEVDLSTVNFYFGGKEGLYAATLKELAVPAAGSRPAGSAESAEDALYRQVLAILRRFVEGEASSTLGRILAHESMNPTEHFEQLVADVLRPELDSLREIARRLAGEGADEAALGRVAMSVMGQCLFYLFARGAVDRIHPGAQSRDCEVLARHITGFSLMGIAVHTSRR